MSEPRTSLDHVGVIVRDLDRGREHWERLGFTLSPLSPQMGLGPGGDFEPWATANHCAVLRTGYLELIGVHRPDRPNPWAAFIDRFEGGHIAALRCGSADETYAALGPAADDFQPPVARRRDAPFHEDGRWTTREMRFRNVFSRDERVPEARYILIEHQTPEVLWQDALLEHANGAIGLDSITFVALDRAMVTTRLEGIGGRIGRPSGGEAAVTFRGGGTVHVLSPETFANRYPGCAHPPTPSIAACTVAVREADATARWLRDHAVEHTRAGDAIIVPPEAGNGITIEFRSPQ